MARGSQRLVEFRPNTGRPELSRDSAVAQDAFSLEEKNILRGDGVGFHPHAFRDVGDATRSIAEARDMNQEIDSRDNLLADGVNAHACVRHSHHD